MALSFQKSALLPFRGFLFAARIDDPSGGFIAVIAEICEKDGKEIKADCCGFFGKKVQQEGYYTEIAGFFERKKRILKNGFDFRL